MASEQSIKLRFGHPEESITISRDMDENGQILEELFRDDDTFILRPVSNRYDPNRRYLLAYCAGMIDTQFVGDSIIRPLTSARTEQTDIGEVDTVVRQLLYAHGPKEADTLAELVEAITYGDTVLLMPGQDKALIISSQGFPLRSIEEPDGEKILSGPREGFCEALLPNLSLIHRKLRTSDVKMRFKTFGERSRTRACLCYLDSLVNRTVLEELERRLETIIIDGVLDANYLIEMVDDHPFSPFSSVGSTERPDVVVSKILEGRVAVFLDGTPVVLTLPYLFVENFHASEDHYVNYIYTSFSRILRIISFCIASLAPGFYIAITAFHPEILPMSLLISIVREKQSVSFPMGVEIVLMLIIFDILRETGIRMPSGIGQAMSIVGAIVLGEAAVSAKIASRLIIIVVALAGITSLPVPKLNAPSLVYRYGILTSSLMMGFPGFVLGATVALAHILSLRSFGMPQVELSGELRAQRMKDIAVRAPIPAMRERGPVSSNRRRSRFMGWRKPL